MGSHHSETATLAGSGPGADAAGNATDLLVSGMTCSNCARHVTEALQSVAGVRSASVNLEANQARVRWESETDPNVPAVIAAVVEAGYEAKVLEAQDQQPRAGLLSGWQLNLWLGLPVTLFLMLGEWVFHWHMADWFRWTAFVLATVVQTLAGARFYVGAWKQLRIGSSNMDTLVALGSTTAYAYSAWVLFSALGGHVYFMEAAAIITLISLGHYIESRVSRNASSALNKLLNLAPAMARQLQPDGTEREVAVAALKSGDQIVLRPGDAVPTDGVVTSGGSAVDETMLTGESLPVDKSAGSEVYAGTVNQSGRLTVKVTATGEQTALANIIAAVQRAQTSRANIQRLGDRVSSVFVPIIVAVAVGAALWWGLAPESAAQVQAWLGKFLWKPLPLGTPVASAFMIASAVLIIACPCAMGLATPAAIMAGSNAAAERGILIRDAVALEKAGHVTAVVLDKTGTLTTGKPTLAQLWDSPSAKGTISGAKLAGALAHHSSHPISRALAAGLPSTSMALTKWEEVRGAGVSAEVDLETGDKAVARLGSPTWLADSGIDLSTGQKFIEEWSKQGTTTVGLAVEKELVSLFAVRDTLKSGAAEVVRQLQASGLQTYLLTGDNKLTAQSIGASVGIDARHVFAEVRPEQKAEFVARLQKEGQRVAFVGDGINDAPALEQADLGIAVSRASDIAREAADVILLKSDIEAVPESLGLARATLRTIKQNLFWAFFYNALGVPLAALGFMSPVLCAAAMGFSDLIVIGNAMRLRRWRSRSP